MLLPYTTLEYYGPGAAAMSLEDGIGRGELLEAIPHQTMEVGASGVGTGYVEVMRPYRGYAAALTVVGEAFAVILAHQRMKVQLNVSVGAVPSAEDIAQAVWLSISSKYNYPNTMGKTLNSAGSAGDPWIADLSSYPEGTAGYTLASLDPEQIATAIMTDPRLLTVAKFLGLK